MVDKNEFVKNILDSLPHPFYIIDANDYTLKMANSAAAPDGLPPNVTCFQLTHGTDKPCEAPRHCCPLETIKRTGKSVTIEHVHYDMEGNARQFEIHAHPVFDSNGNVVQIVECMLDITERRKAEEELDLYAEITRNIAEGVVLARVSDTEIVYANHKFEEMFGYDPGELIGKPISVVNAPGDKSPEELAKMIQKPLKEKGTWQGEVHNIKKDGTPFWCNVTVSTFDHYKYGEVWVWVPRDITERRQTEDALRKSETMYRTLVENIPQKVFMKDTDSRYVSINEHFARDLGIRDAEVFGKTDYDFFPRELADKYRRDDKRIIKTGVTEDLEEHYMMEDQGMWVQTIKAPVKDVNGKVVGVFGIFWDITDRKRAENALRESEERFSRFFRASPVGITISRLCDGQCIEANDAFLRLFGYEREEVIGGNLFELKKCIDPKERETLTQRLTEQGRVEAFETRLRLKSGEIMYAITSAEIIELAGRQCILSLTYDITARKRAEQALVLERNKFRRFLDSLPFGVYIVNDQYNIEYVNSVLSSDFGPIEGRKCHDYFHGLLEPCDWCKNSEVFDGKTVQWEWFSEKTGKTFHLIDSPVYSVDDRISKIEVFFDITERKRAEAEKIEMEQRIQKLQKAESLGRMAGSIAHHFNNKLGTVLGNLELALYDLPEESEVRATIVESMKAARQAADISQRMLMYLGQATGRYEPVDLVDTIRESLQLSSLSVPRHVRLKTDYPLMRPIIQGNNAQIKQILANLVSNAVEAIGQNDGDITVAIQVTQSEKIKRLRFFPVDWEPKAEQYVCLSVSDTGCGMDLTTIEKVFDPFFSTKFPGRGLGLSILLGLVRTHAGGTTVVSEPDRGATFRVFFPLCALEAVPPVKEEPLASGPAQKGGLVLLVDDDPGIRKMAESILEKMGYGVLGASSGAQALKFFAEDPYRVRLVITDLTMPGMDGWQILTALRKIRPNIPVVLASGYDEAHAMSRDYAHQPDVFLHKPYSMSELKSAIDEALQAVSRG
ncbi:MAG: PAS domain S-box protein [Syntrophobacteraceae bacterium]|nr:PAS domain S-box protein [Syntrophobacteraceae bacterium]